MNSISKMHWKAVKVSILFLFQLSCLKFILHIHISSHSDIWAEYICVYQNSPFMALLSKIPLPTLQLLSLPSFLCSAFFKTVRLQNLVQIQPLTRALPQGKTNIKPGNSPGAYPLFTCIDSPPVSVCFQELSTVFRWLFHTFFFHFLELLVVTY